jgi:hypothetical protein
MRVVRLKATLIALLRMLGAWGVRGRRWWDLGTMLVVWVRLLHCSWWWREGKRRCRPSSGEARGTCGTMGEREREREVQQHKVRLIFWSAGHPDYVGVMPDMWCRRSFLKQLHETQE